MIYNFSHARNSYQIKISLLLVIISVVFTACAPQVAVTQPATNPVQDHPVTLKFAVSDGQGSSASASYAAEFIQQVKTLSHGNITLEPTWSAGDSTDVGYEQGVVELVKKGDFDLGLAASRAFDGQNVTSFQSLQAPFLIDNDALAKAVATSDIAKQMLNDLSSSGLAGLTMWPEDLRHPFSLVPGKPFLSPADFVGLNIRTTPSGVSESLVKALGGKPMFGDDGYEGAESGLRQGATLNGKPTVTGNVTFFAKYQILFANAGAFRKLSDSQRTLLQQAADAVQKKAIAEHPSEADAARAWCADSGTVVLASQDQLASFQAAAKPVFDQIEQNPLNAKFVTEIQDLKTKTPPAPGAVACAPVNPLPTLEPTKAEVWSQGLPPNGVWQSNVTVDDFVRRGVPRSIAAAPCPGPDCWAPILYRISFQDGTFVFKGLDPNNPKNLKGYGGGCQAHYELSGGDALRLTYFQIAPKTDECPDQVDEIQWRMDNDGLHLHLVQTWNGPYEELKAFYEAKVWQKVATP